MNSRFNTMKTVFLFVGLLLFTMAGSNPSICLSEPNNDLLSSSSGIVSASIPMILISGKFPAFPVKIAGKEYFAYFDSGAKGFTLDEELSHHGSLIPGKKANYGGAGGEIREAKFYNIPSISFGSLHFLNSEVLARPILATFSKSKEGIQAILNIGSKVLHDEEVIVVIDYPAKQISFTDKIPSELEMQLVHFQWLMDTILVDGKINGVSANNMILDTCAGMSSVSTKFLSKVAYGKSEKQINVKDATGKTRTLESVTLCDFSFSGLKIPKVDVYVASEAFERRSKRFGKEINGIIGADIFRDNILIIDYKNNKLAIIPANSSSIQK